MRPDQEILYDPDTSQDVLHDILEQTAAQAAGMHMRAARAATDPELARQRKEEMKAAWELTRAFDLTRQETIEHILRLRQAIDQEA